MTDRKFSMDDYVDVAERIQDFIDAYPDGSLQTIDWEVSDVAGKTFITYRAAAYRTPDDPRPGHGTAWEPFPGQTSFTRNSELMNAETAAWGRAILALGLIANRKLASRQEVRNRQAEQDAESETRPKPAARGRSTGKGNAQATSSNSHSEAQNASQATDDSGPVTEDTLTELRRVYKESKVTSPQLKAILKECGAEGKTPDQLSEDQATWVFLKLSRRSSA